MSEANKHPGGRTTKNKFGPVTTKIIIDAVSSGADNREACRRAGITATSLNNWLELGRNTQPGYYEFFQEYENARFLRSRAGLSHDDLILMLEEAARHGSLRAMELLLVKPWEKKVPDVDPTQKSLAQLLAEA